MPNYQLLIFNFLTSVAICVVIISSIIKIADRYNIYEKITFRKIHHKKISFLGSIGIFFAFFMSSFIFEVENGQNFNFKLIYFTSFFIFFVGIGDDFFAFSSFKKMFLQIIAIILIFYKLELNLVNIMYNIVPIENRMILTILTYCLVGIIMLGIINSFNLIDGQDGLCATLSIISLLAFIFIFLKANDLYFLSIAISLLGALIGFLHYNKPKAKIFMGDGGSLFVGFIISLFTLYFISNYKNKFIDFTLYQRINLSFAILGVPLLDMFRVFVLRFINLQNPFKGDRKHIHHVLNELGYSNYFLLFYIICLQIFLIFIATQFSNVKPIIFIPIVTFIYLALMMIIDNIKNIKRQIKESSYFSYSKNKEA